MVQMNLFTKQEQIHRLQKQTMVTKREMSGEVYILGLGLTYTH